MTCTLPDAELQDWFDGELEPFQARHVQQHVAWCPACQRRLHLWEDLRAVLQTQAAAQKALPHVHAQIERHLQRFERRHRLWWNAVVAMVAFTLLSALASLYWWLPRQEPSSLVTELTQAHAALVRGELSLTYRSADAVAIQSWLGERLPFRPFVPRVEAAGFRLRGTRTLLLAGHTAAAISFRKAGQLYSLISLPDAGMIPDGGETVELEGSSFWVVRRVGYTLVLWSVWGLVYAMIADDDRDELLEYAALCMRQMRPPA